MINHHTLTAAMIDSRDFLAAKCRAETEFCFPSVQRLPSNVTQIVFKPDWHRHARAAPFKRNDPILDVLPIGVIVFPARASLRTSPTRRRSLASQRPRAHWHPR
jgi:hypothetical protein